MSSGSKPMREEWGIRWAMRYPGKGYFARVAYRSLNSENFHQPLGEKIGITAEQFEAITCPGEWQPAETMPDWAVRQWEEETP